jgi:ribose/xylose/arabinose/galactoside ABC-type transport system permease subunit
MVALGMSMVLLSGGIDLSLGALLGLMGVVTVLLCHGGTGVSTSIIAGVGTVGILGTANGILIARTGLPPFIVTFGMMGIAQSLSLALSKGSSLPEVPFPIQYLGTGTFLTIPIPVWIATVSVLAISILLSNTRYGVYIYGIGADEQSALLSGINVKKCKMIVYFLAALLAGIGGLITIGRMNSAHPTVGIGMEFEAIASAVIGGTSLFGGVGGVSGTVVGVLLIGALRNGLDLMMIPGTWQISIIGAIILTAVVADAVLRRR